jgi:DNA-binding transcriptional LysR family regulator
MCAYFPDGHSLEGRRVIRLRDVVAYPLILTARDSSVRQLLERVLASERLAITLACEANYMSTAIGLVRAGIGVSILPESAFDTASSAGVGRKVISTAALTRKVGIVRRRGRSLSPAAEKFAQACAEFVAHRAKIWAGASVERG